jgi:hypothetical protein
MMLDAIGIVPTIAGFPKEVELIDKSKGNVRHNDCCVDLKVRFHP